MNSRDLLEHCLDSSRHALSDAKGLYLHTCSRVFKNREGTINLFHLSIQRLKVPSISMVVSAVSYKGCQGSSPSVQTWKAPCTFALCTIPHPISKCLGTRQILPLVHGHHLMVLKRSKECGSPTDSKFQHRPCLVRPNIDCLQETPRLTGFSKLSNFLCCKRAVAIWDCYRI